MNLNDEDAIVYYNLRGSTSATNKHLTAGNGCVGDYRCVGESSAPFMRVLFTNIRLQTCGPNRQYCGHSMSHDSCECMHVLVRGCGSVKFGILCVSKPYLP